MARKKKRLTMEEAQDIVTLAHDGVARRELAFMFSLSLGYVNCLVKHNTLTPDKYKNLRPQEAVPSD